MSLYMVAQRCPHRSCWNLSACYFTCKKDFATVTKVKDFDLEREFWVIQVNPT